MKDAELKFHKSDITLSEEITKSPLAIPQEKRNKRFLLEFSCSTNCDTIEKSSPLLLKSTDQVKINKDSFRPL